MKIGFVGAGNMATGIARGWAAARDESGAPEAMLFADADADRARGLAEEVGGEALDSNRAVAEASDLVLLAVKPNVLDEVAEELVEAGTPVLSILAGTPLERLRSALPGIELARVMPNLGAQLRQAVLCVAFPEDVADERRKKLEELLGLLGEVIELDEELIDAATALMGCSPGYLALFAEVLVSAGVEEGLSEELVEAGTPVLSILAGTPLERLRSALPGIELVRVMPNLGAQLRQAVLCVTFPEDFPSERRESVEALLGLLGEVIELDEDLIDAATALMGCSPGYLALFAEVLVSAGVDEGLSEDQAQRMVAQSMVATGGLLEHHQPGALKRAVASPGGMTEAGLEELERRKFWEALQAAVDASLARVRG